MTTVKEMLRHMAYSRPVSTRKAIDIATIALLSGPFGCYLDGVDVLMDGGYGSTGIATCTPIDLERMGQDLLSAPLAHAELDTLAAVLLVLEFKAGMLLDKVTYRGPDGMYRSCDPTDIRNLGLQVIENNDPEGSDSFSIWTRTYTHPILPNIDVAAHYLRIRHNAFIARSSSGAVVAATWTYGGLQLSATAEQLATLGSYVHDATANAYDRWIAWLEAQPKADDTVAFSHACIPVRCRMADMPRVACLVDASDFDLVIPPDHMVRLFPGRPELHTHTPLTDALLYIGAELMEGDKCD